MKKQYFIFTRKWLSISILLIAVSFIYSCHRQGVSNLFVGQKGGIPDTVYQTDTVTVEGEGEMILKPFIALGGDHSVAVSYAGGDLIVPIISNGSWNASSEDSWIQLSKNNGEKGKDTIVLTIDKNISKKNRSGEVKIASTSGELMTILTLVQHGGSDNFFVKVGADGNGHSWAEAGKLDSALKEVQSGDTIFVAAGTYLPKKVLAGAEADNDDKDKTFEISKNITLIGGFPAEANAGAVSNPVKNETIFSGNDESYHVVTITAPKESGKQVNIQGVTITKGNTAESSSVVISSNNNLEYDRYFAGGVFIVGATVSLENVNVVENKGYYGVGVTADKEADITIKNSKINKNKSHETAAGLRVMGKSTVKIIQSEVNENTSTASFGGGVYILDGSEVAILNSQINKNQVAGNGSGIRANAGATITIKNSEINNNIAGDGGGGMWLDGVEITIENSEINGNKANEGHSGGIYAKNGTTLEITNSEINNNYTSEKSSGGGGLDVRSNSDLTVHNSVIEGNKSDEIAGGVYLDDVTANFYDSKINNNTSQTYGAGFIIYDNKTVVNFYDCEINGNESLTTRAGGMYTYANLSMYNTIMTGNKSKGFGAAIYVRSGSKNYLVNCLIAENIATADDGGAIFQYTEAEVTIVSSTIADNETTGKGGAIYRWKGGSDNILKVYNSIISGNTQATGSSDIDAASGLPDPVLVSTVVDTMVYDASGSEIAGVPFDPNSLGNSYLPNGSNNPALTYGMAGSDLTGLGLSNVENSYLTIDIDGDNRNDKIMGYKLP